MRSTLLSLAALVAAGCFHRSDENLGIATRSDAPVDLSRLAQPGGLEAALAVPAAAVEGRLGPHARAQAAKITLTSADRSDVLRSEVLEETWRTEIDADRAIHALHDNSREYGKEWLLVGGQLYSRVRYGRFARRDPQGDEVDRERDLQAGALAGYLDVLGRFASRESGGTEAGRARVKLGLASSPRSLGGVRPGQEWRKTIKVSALDGEAAFDAASGALVKARLDAKYTFTRDGKEIAVALSYTSETTPGAVEKIAPPADAVVLSRPRPLLDRNELLEGLVRGRE